MTHLLIPIALLGTSPLVLDEEVAAALTGDQPPRGDAFAAEIAPPDPTLERENRSASRAATAGIFVLATAATLATTYAWLAPSSYDDGPGCSSNVGCVDPLPYVLPAAAAGLAAVFARRASGSAPIIGYAGVAVSYIAIVGGAAREDGARSARLVAAGTWASLLLFTGAAIVANAGTATAVKSAMAQERDNSAIIAPTLVRSTRGFGPGLALQTSF